MRLVVAGNVVLEGACVAGAPALDSLLGSGLRDGGGDVFFLGAGERWVGWIVSGSLGG